MEKIRVITDSASDILESVEEESGIQILPFAITIGDQSYISRQDFDAKGFYDLMEQNPDELPKTSQITPFAFQEMYLENAEAGYTDLILVLINSKGSATYTNAIMARDLFFEDNPEYEDKMHIHVFDGLGYSAMYGQPAVDAAKMAKDGKSVAEIIEYLEYIMPRRKVYFGMYTLKYAGKSGRIPSAAAFVGDRLNLKPIMKIYNKSLDTAAKVRGENKLMPKVVELTVADMEEGSPYELVVGNDETANKLVEDLMTEAVGYGPSGYYPIGAAVAANAGPKTVGIAFKVKADMEIPPYAHE